MAVMQEKIYFFFLPEYLVNIILMPVMPRVDDAQRYPSIEF